MPECPDCACPGKTDPATGGVYCGNPSCRRAKSRRWIVAPWPVKPEPMPEPMPEPTLMTTPGWGAGEEARDEGIEFVTRSNAEFIDAMRAYAVRRVRETGQVSSDDLRRFAQEQRIQPEHQNAWGAIFRGKQWRVVGRTRSRLTTNHAREIRVWALA